MATASTQDNSWWCHKCSRSVSGVNEQDIQCPICHSGFLEKLEYDESAADAGDHDDFNQENLPAHMAQLFNHMGGGSGFQAAGPGFTFQFQSGPHSSTARPQGRDRFGQPSRLNNASQAPANTFQGLFEQIIGNLTGGAVHFVVNQDDNNAGGMPFFLNIPGNLGDYAMNPAQFDAIITQLLNQVEGGIAPMTKEAIEKLPRQQITQEQVDKHLQCPVCFDDFKLDETVLALVCSHVYHPDCITPWLERHNTCPVCRKAGESETGSSPAGASGNEPPSTGGSGTGSRSSAAGSNPPQRNPFELDLD